MPILDVDTCKWIRTFRLGLIPSSLSERALTWARIASRAFSRILASDCAFEINIQ